MSEQKFNKKVQDLIKSGGWYVIKTIVTNRAGVPDIIACINGRFCCFEGKLKYNKMSPLQIAHRKEIIQAGGLAMEIKSLSDAQQLIDWAESGYIQKIEDLETVLPTFVL